MRPLAMDSASMNPYEQQLYTVFKTFDVDNEEALNKSAVLDLCNALQLEDRGAALVGSLFERSSDRVTFTQFRNGLLSVLSDAASAAPEPAVEPERPGPTTPGPTEPGDEDSSGREVAPKFVFGSKKYGRRSRPQRGSDAHTPRAASVSRIDAADERARAAQRMRGRRSASAMETRDLDATADDDVAPDAFDHDRRVDRDEALGLCRDLRMDGIDRSLVDRIFEDSGATDTTTVGQFFDRLNAALTTTIEVAAEAGAAPGPGGDDPEDDDAGVPSEVVVDAWERAGVPRPRRLLLELGFGAAAVRPPDLERALDDELAALAEPLDERRDARVLVLAAAYALGRLRLRVARRRADVAAAERDKLRADVAEANRRARLLAQDVDEAHARLEAELAATLRRAEARHAESARVATEEAVAERERAAAERARLEVEVARRAEAEVRLRAEAEAQRARFEGLETRAAAAEGRAAAAEREVVRLAEEARAAAASGAGGANAGGGEAARRELEARLEELRREAQRLRDRNDELCGALEARAGAGAGAGGEGLACGDLSAELRSVMTPEALEVSTECDSAPVSIEQKVPEYTELGAVRCEVCGGANGVGGVVTRQSVGRQDADAQTEAPSTDSDLEALVEELRKDLVDAESFHENEKLKLTELITELEASLEALREEYERCEEYWENKLRTERAAADDELRAADARLATLLARVAECERRARPPPLPPVAEHAALEAQVADLEREFAAHRAQAEAALASRDEEIARLRAARPRPHPHPHAHPRDYCNQAFDTPDTPIPAGGALDAGSDDPCSALAARCRLLVAALNASRSAGAAGAGSAAALRARAARAEAALRRLGARLRAADLLVKELYVENCHLAHRRAP